MFGAFAARCRSGCCVVEDVSKHFTESLPNKVLGQVSFSLALPQIGFVFASNEENTLEADEWEAKAARAR